jgi:hypothetical protein
VTLLILDAALLGPARRKRVLELLGSPALRWELSAALGRTTSGPMWQLADRESHRTAEMREVAATLAGAVYDLVSDRLPDLLPPPDQLSPQVFPVRMTGGEDDPPQQWPHEDGVDGRRPVTTAVYYPRVRGTVGGALRLHGSDGTLEREVTPAEDHLVVMTGDQTHSVAPLTAGERLTVVVNFYTGGDR